MTISQLNQAHNIFKQLEKIAKTLHRLDENDCNYGLSKAQETRQVNLEKRAEELAQELGLHAFHQGDPRGASLYLVENKKAYNNYTNGIAIY